MEAVCEHCGQSHTIRDEQLRHKVGLVGFPCGNCRHQVVLTLVRADNGDAFGKRLVTSSTASETRAPGATPPDKPATPEDMLRNWAEFARLRQHGHFVAGRRLQLLHRLLGVPVVILSTIVGTTVFASLEHESLGRVARIVVGSISVVSAVLASIQTFLRLAERSEHHLSCAGRYAAIRRQIDQVLLLRSNNAEEFRAGIKEINEKLDGVQAEEPTISRDDIRRARTEDFSQLADITRIVERLGHSR
jgi:hypothetical protein